MRKLEKCKLMTLLPAAYMLHGAKKLGRAARQNSARMIALLLAAVMLVSLVPMQASAASIPSGYTATANGHMAYKIMSSSIDVMGNFNDNYIQTTYSNGGYKATWSMYGAAVVYTASSVSGGRYVKLTLNVTAGSNGVTNGKLAIYADTMIGSNDSAAIEVIKSGNEVIGIKMADNGSGAQFSLLFANAPGVTDVDTYWFGVYGEHDDKCYDQLNASSKSSYGTYNSDLTSYSGADSACAFSWQNINLNPGQKAAYSVIVGVGEVAEPVAWYDTGLTLDRDTVEYGETANVTASIKDAASMTEELYVTVDDSYEEILLGSFSSGTGIAAGTFALDSTVIGGGDHTLTFWVMNQEGAMTPLVYKDFKVTGAAPVALSFDYTAPADTVYSGEKKTATVVSGANVTDLGEITVKYYKNGVLCDPIEVGTYEVRIDVAASNTWPALNDYTEASWTFEITKKSAVLANPIAQNSIAYGAKLSNVGLPAGWTWAEPNTVPPINNSGYIAYYTPADTENYDWTGVSGWDNTAKRVARTVAVTVNKADATCTAPTANAGLIYSGAAQTLISAGSATGGTMQYALGTATGATGS